MLDWTLASALRGPKRRCIWNKGESFMAGIRLNNVHPPTEKHFKGPQRKTGPRDKSRLRSSKNRNEFYLFELRDCEEIFVTSDRERTEFRRPEETQSCCSFGRSQVTWFRNLSWILQQRRTNQWWRVWFLAQVHFDISSRRWRSNRWHCGYPLKHSCCDLIPCVKTVQDRCCWSATQVFKRSQVRYQLFYTLTLTWRISCAGWWRAAKDKYLKWFNTFYHLIQWHMRKLPVIISF